MKIVILIEILAVTSLVKSIKIPYNCANIALNSCECDIYMNDGSRHIIEYNLRCSDESLFINMFKNFQQTNGGRNRLHLTKWNSITSLEKYPTEKFKTIFGVSYSDNQTKIFIDTENYYEKLSEKKKFRVFYHLLNSNITCICSS
ncbi:hypothetical protein MXB_3422 [Myxobolus squamalis]|nr:hypothetical protein MXB_3422 [Myxobolus squamalis]